MGRLNNKKVLVTGGAGFIGSHMTRRLLEEQAEVILLLRRDTDLWRIQDVVQDLRILPVGDTIDRNFLDEQVAGVDYLIHLAFSGVNQSIREVDVVYFQNLQNLNALLEFAADKRIGKFLYTGSCFEYPDESRVNEATVPSAGSLYAAAKIAGWHLAQAYSRTAGLSVVGVRPFTVYGPFEASYRLVPTIITGVLLQREVDLTEGLQVRDFIHVQDVVDAYIQLIVSENNVAGEVFNVCTGRETTVRDLVDGLSRILNKKSIANFGRVPYRDNEFMSLSGDPAKLQNRTGWRPRLSLDEGLARTIEWFVRNLPKYRSRYDKQEKP